MRGAREDKEEEDGKGASPASPSVDAMPPPRAPAPPTPRLFESREERFTGSRKVGALLSKGGASWLGCKNDAPG
jgi:hypothetical protein